MPKKLVQTLSRVPGFGPAWIVYRQWADRFGRQARRLSLDSDRPRLLTLETSARCNFRCPKCANSLSKRPRGLMDVALAISALDQARELGIRSVVLSMGGEPLLHPELETIVAAARDRGLAPYFVTNAALLMPERARRLIDAGLANLNVSFDGWDEESYRERQVGGSLAQTLGNLRRFRELRGPNASPKLYSVTVLDSQSLPHVDRILDQLAPVVDTLSFVPLMDFGFPGRRIDRALMLGERSWRRTPCSLLWQDLAIGWDGRVTACCNDQDYDLAYADLNRQSLREIWASPALREWRRLHLAGNFGSMPLCGDCTIDYQKSFAHAWLCYRLGRRVAKKRRQD